MFAWANKHLEKLSQTLAPPPNDPAHRFAAALSSKNESLALSLLSPYPPPFEDGTPCPSLPSPTFPLHPSSPKGTTAIHLAAQHGACQVLRALLQSQNIASPDSIVDMEGWTPLHYAASADHARSAADALATVKMLVVEYGASVVARNGRGQTPYDLGALDAVRQYLLPLQLQRETQDCLDNGGVGLPEGIDLGGLKVSGGAAIPPPPIHVGPPPIANYFAEAAASSSSASISDSNEKYVTPTFGVPTDAGINGHAPPVSNFSPPPPMNASPPSHHGPVTATAAATVTSSAAPAAISTATVPPSNASPIHNDSSNNNTTPPSMPTTAPTPTPPQPAQKHEYARRGHSSAALLPANSKYKPDGFHSSSSDVSLQRKYGHVSASHANGLAPPSVSPPAPAPGQTYNYNPYAATTARGYPAGVHRYPTYDAVGNVVGVPSNSNSNSNWYGAPSAAATTTVPKYSVFQPGAGSSSSSASQQPTYAAPNSYPTNNNSYSPQVPYSGGDAYSQQPQQQQTYSHEQQSQYQYQGQGDLYSQSNQNQQQQPYGEGIGGSSHMDQQYATQNQQYATPPHQDQQYATPPHQDQQYATPPHQQQQHQQPPSQQNFVTTNVQQENPIHEPPSTNTSPTTTAAATANTFTAPPSQSTPATSPPTHVQETPSSSSSQPTLAPPSDTNPPSNTFVPTAAADIFANPSPPNNKSAPPAPSPPAADVFANPSPNKLTTPPITMTPAPTTNPADAAKLFASPASTATVSAKDAFGAPPPSTENVLASPPISTGDGPMESSAPAAPASGILPPPPIVFDSSPSLSSPVDVPVSSPAALGDVDTAIATTHTAQDEDGSDLLPPPPMMDIPLSSS